MIKSYLCKETEKIFSGNISKRWDQITNKKALIKLEIINALITLNDTEILPENIFYKSKGELEGYYTIDIDHQWKIIFIWSNGDAENVKIIDFN